MLSWVTAITITPLLGFMFLKPKVSEGADADPYNSTFYRPLPRLSRRLYSLSSADSPVSSWVSSLCR